MPRRHASQHPAPPTPRIDVAAVGDRLWRLRYQRQWTQATLAQRAGLDPMVISRLEAGRKPRLEVETAARLAQACGWTLDQVCGLAPVPGLPVAPFSRWYCPLGEPCPDWLAEGIRHSTDDRQLAALIMRWQDRGARMPHIVQTLQAWGLVPFHPGQRGWTAHGVAAMLHYHTHGTKQGRKDVLAACKDAEPPARTGLTLWQHAAQGDGTRPRPPQPVG